MRWNVFNIDILRLGYTYIHQWSGLPLIQVMTHHLYFTKTNVKFSTVYAKGKNKRNWNWCDKLKKTIKNEYTTAPPPPPPPPPPKCQNWYCIHHDIFQSTCMCLKEEGTTLNSSLLHAHSIDFFNPYRSGNSWKSIRCWLALWLLMHWCFSTRSSAATILTKYPFFRAFTQNGCFQSWNDSMKIDLKKIIITMIIIINMIKVHYHIKAETKWPPFSRWHFQMHFLEWKLFYFEKIFIEICFSGSN